MIQVISGHYRHHYQNELNDMHGLRKRVFADRLGWDVSVRDGLEIDGFDRADPTYILAQDDVTGRLTGCLRLLPTTGPTMLRDVFSELLPGEDVASATIWECSRFALNVEEAQARTGRLSRTTSELLCAMVELGLEVGLSEIVAVYDARMARIFRAADCLAEPIGVSRRIGRVVAHAALFEISEAMWKRIAQAAGISAPVISSINGAAQEIRRAA